MRALVKLRSFPAIALADQACLRISGRGVCGIAALPPVEVVTGIAAIHRTKALRLRPCFVQRADYRRMRVAAPFLHARQQHHVLEEALHERFVEQTHSIEREGRVIPFGIVHIESPGPAEQQVVVELFLQQPIAARVVDHLQQRSASKAVGCRNGHPLSA